jgi:hypothetical protein
MVHKFRLLAAFAGLLLFITGSLFAQSPQELRFGTAVPGLLREGEEQWFSIRAAEGGFVTVETSGITDTYLEAYDTDSNLIDEDDDGGEDINAKLEILAEAGKNYLIKLRGVDEEEGGRYSIRASFESFSRERELRPGNWVFGNLSGGETHFYSFRPAAAGALIVETSGDIDTILKVYEASQGYITWDDDSGEGYNARLEISVEAGKKYLFRLGCYNVKEGGPYRIRANFEALPPDTERNTERSMAVPLRPREPVTIFFRTTSESRWYRYDIPRSGTTFTVQPRGTLDTYMVLYDAQGNVIAENDDGEEDYNAFISLTLNSRTVYIEVRPYGAQMGRCTLHAEIR